MVFEGYCATGKWRGRNVGVWCGGLRASHRPTERHRGRNGANLVRGQGATDLTADCGESRRGERITRAERDPGGWHLLAEVTSGSREWTQADTSDARRSGTTPGEARSWRLRSRSTPLRSWRSEGEGNGWWVSPIVNSTVAGALAARSTRSSPEMGNGAVGMARRPTSACVQSVWRQRPRHPVQRHGSFPRAGTTSVVLLGNSDGSVNL